MPSLIVTTLPRKSLEGPAGVGNVPGLLRTPLITKGPEEKEEEELWVLEGSVFALHQPHQQDWIGTVEVDRWAWIDWGE